MSHLETDPDPTALIDGQRNHWEQAFAADRNRYGQQPSLPGSCAVGPFAAKGVSTVLELGPGQGRDTLAFLRAGLTVTALDYAAGPLASIAITAGNELSSRLTTAVHDVRQPLPSSTACCSHMLFTTALSRHDLIALASEVHRVLRAGGICAYTVRHVDDPQHGVGLAFGDNLYQNGGFVVHLFVRGLVDRLSSGFEIEDLTAFEEGDPPWRLWRVTMRRTGSGTSGP